MQDMAPPRRVLAGDANPPESGGGGGGGGSGENDSDVVIILAGLLCAVICVLGLIAVARCTWIRRLTGNRAGASAATGANRSGISPNKGLKKKTLRSLPKATFNGESDYQLSDCAICLTEFAIGDEIRVLPQCGHVFHLPCIDTWFRSHASCPSCRKVLAISMCQKCGDLSASSSSVPASEAKSKERQDDENRFLP